MIPVIDIFAGPGGLGEGFASVSDSNGNPVFDVRLSIEKESYACRTLKLRTFFRELPVSERNDYYSFLRQELDLDELYSRHEVQAKAAAGKCWEATLGPEGKEQDEIRGRIQSALGKRQPWVLIGGPPCQAYSLAGRSRNLGKASYNPDSDTRQRLYVEYLQILADHQPAVFIMENVKGLLSASLRNEKIFHRILEDLRCPAQALKREDRSSSGSSKSGYTIYSIVNGQEFSNGRTEGAVIKAENHGVPQARHRVILLGVSDAIAVDQLGTLQTRLPASVQDVIGSLPYLRSGLSNRRGSKDSAAAWVTYIRSQVGARWANAGTCKVASEELSKSIRKTIKAIEPPAEDRGNEFLEADAACTFADGWLNDERIGGVCNHSTRGHMAKDLCRYLYAACYASLHGKSPVLGDFPTDLLPEHANVDTALKSGGYFSDRFRVQLSDRTSTTIVSHISKDGHYYIHPDPRQCRSLTVREAARLQTFPDNYFFCGPRTQQYIQVGNAVPPYLANQIGRIVYDLLLSAGANE